MTEEVLIYDLDANKAHCLNDTSVTVWKACDGKNTVADIVEVLEKHTRSKVNENLVWLAIDQLNERNLLSGSIPQKFAGKTRREIIMTIGLASVMALPIVSSLVAPQAIYAQSCSGTVANCIGCPQGTPCDVDMDTIIGMCLGGACAGD